MKPRLSESALAPYHRHIKRLRRLLDAALLIRGYPETELAKINDLLDNWRTPLW